MIFKAKSFYTPKQTIMRHPGFC